MERRRIRENNRKKKELEKKQFKITGKDRGYETKENYLQNKR